MVHPTDDLPDLGKVGGLTEPEAAQWLRVSQRTLADERKAGAIGYMRIGKSFIYPIDALHAYVRQKTTPPKVTPDSEGGYTRSGIRYASSRAMKTAETRRIKEAVQRARVIAKRLNGE